MSLAADVIAWIEGELRVLEGPLAGEPFALMPWRRFIRVPARAGMRLALGEDGGEDLDAFVTAWLSGAVRVSDADLRLASALREARVRRDTSAMRRTRNRLTLPDHLRNVPTSDRREESLQLLGVPEGDPDGPGTLALPP